MLTPQPRRRPIGTPLPGVRVPAAPVAAGALLPQLDLGNISRAAESLNRAGVREAQVRPLMDAAIAQSPTRSLMLAKGILQRKVDGKEKEREARALVQWGREGNPERRKMVCRAFGQSRMNLALVHEVSGMTRPDARAYMKDYFEAGGDLKSVAEWLQIAGGVLRRHRVKQPDTAGDVVKWVSDTVEDGVDAAADGINALVDAVVSAGKTLAEVVGQAASWTVDKIADLVTGLIEAGKTAAAVLAEAVKQGVSVLKKFVKALVQVGRSVTEILVWAAGQVAATMDAVVKALLEIGRTVKQVLDAVITQMAATLKKIVQALYRLDTKVGTILIAVAGRAVSILRTVMEGLLAVGVQLTIMVASICTDVVAAFRRGFFEGLIALGKAPLQILQAALLAGASVLALAFAVFLEIWGGHRGLLPAEMTEARRVFGWSIDLGRVKIARASIPADVANWLNGQRPFTTMYVINFASNATIDMPTLIHELTHVWQAVVAGPVYMVEALHSQFFGKGYQVTDQDLANAGGEIERLEREQQAVVVERYWVGKWGNGGGNWQKYEPFARQVYSPRPRTIRFHDLVPVSRIPTIAAANLVIR